jgi:hypothetical protein
MLGDVVMAHDTQNVQEQLVGFWKIVRGDYPLINEYQAGGMLVQHVGERVSKPIPFRVEGDHLVTSLEQPDGTISEDRKRFELSADRLTLIDSAGWKSKFRRVGAEQPSIASKPWWRFW